MHSFLWNIKVNFLKYVGLHIMFYLIQFDSYFTGILFKFIYKEKLKNEY